MRGLAVAIAVLCAAGAAYAAEWRPKVTTQDMEQLEQKDAKPKQPNPLDTVADEMVKAQVKLKQGRTDREAQEGMVNAIGLLDRLIEIAEQQQQQQQQDQRPEQREQERKDDQAKPENSQQSNPQQQGRQPARSSKEGGRRGKEATGAERGGEKGIEWGNLPPKTREEYDQILKEDFPEAYKRLLEQYYQNLSD